MSNPIETFFSAWSETDAIARHAAVAASFAKNGTYADPRAPEIIIGSKALADYVGLFISNAPGGSATVVKSDEVAGVARATVAFSGKGPDGTDMLQHGQYFVETEGHTIKRMVGFAGTGAPE